jgi:hypothetical protein
MINFNFSRTPQIRLNKKIMAGRNGSMVESKTEPNESHKSEILKKETAIYPSYFNKPMWHGKVVNKMEKELDTQKGDQGTLDMYKSLF